MSAGHKDRRRLIAITVICIIAALLVLSAILYSHYFCPSRGDEPVRVVIEEGESASQIASKLHANGVVTSANIFRFLAWLQGRQGDFKPGIYSFYTGMHYGEVFAMLEAGPEKHLVRLTIPEGLTVEQTAERVSRVIAVSAEEFTAAASDGDYQMDIIPVENQTNLEGFLFPKTYDLAAEMTAREVVEVLLAQFDIETSGLDWTQAAGMGVSPYQVVIIASLIEREAMLDDERPLVSAVIYNRLRIGMPLQIDATVQYALPEWKDVLTYADLETPSPYNTYLHGGVPPAPICSPGLASIRAALNPADVDYIYYLATGDGAHFFTADYDEFLRVKREVQGQ
jgi:UPF0755 protein